MISNWVRSDSLFLISSAIFTESVMIRAGITCYEIFEIFFLIDRPYHDFPVLVWFFTNLRDLTLASLIVKSSSSAPCRTKQQMIAISVNNAIKYSVAPLMTDIMKCGIKSDKVICIEKTGPGICTGITAQRMPEFLAY